MRRLLLLAAVVGLLAAAADHAGAASKAVVDGQEVGIGPAIPTSPPNFVLIQTDDQTYNDLYATMRDAYGYTTQVMPATLKLIARQGMSFNRYYATYPLCCPARATLLTGQYAHTNGVIGNAAPRGGWQGFRRSRAYRHNIAAWLMSAGYRTVHIGKFLNQYGSDEKPESEVPPGWEVWRTDATDNSTRHFYGYMSNFNGTIRGPFGNVNYGRFAAVDPPGCLNGPAENPLCNHKTDWITRHAVEQIQDARRDRRPFYIQLDYNAPHGDHQPPIGPEPTIRNYGRADGTPIPRTPAFNEADISDKPSFIRERANRFNSVELRRIRIEHRKSLESLRDVDDGVRRIIAALRQADELDNTYVIFISDNGFFRGEHRLDRAKFLPYEPAVHMPLLIRGPGVPKNSVSGELAANIDLAPTIAELAGAQPTSRLDGRSLVPFLRNPELRTRRPILLESFAKATNVEDAPGSGDPGTLPDPADEDGSASSSSVPDGVFVGPVRPGRRGQATTSIAAPVENYGGVRLGRYKYVEYETGDVELYDLKRDPHELRNRAGFPNYRYVQGFLAHQLRRLIDCHGRECQFTTGIIPLPGEAKSKIQWGKRKSSAPKRSRAR
jgi:N-acetylglucosamine-6-sulfatase